jgi:AbrB family looped-hinge helix DNA binding protein
LLDATQCGIFYGMRTTIDRAGRVVVPKVLRRVARLKPGTELEIRVVEGRIEMQPLPAKVKLVRRGGLLVAIPSGGVERLKAADVEAVTQALRERRAGSEHVEE